MMINEIMKEKVQTLGKVSGSKLGYIHRDPRRHRFPRKSTFGLRSTVQPGTSLTLPPPPVMNLSMISMSRNEKNAKIIMEEGKDLEESIARDSDESPPSSANHHASNSQIAFLGARIKNLNEKINEVDILINQEKNSIDSAKVRKRRVKNLIMAMLTKLLRHPVEAL